MSRKGLAITIAVAAVSGLAAAMVAVPHSGWVVNAGVMAAITSAVGAAISVAVIRATAGAGDGPGAEPAAEAQRLGLAYQPVGDPAFRERYLDLAEIPRNAKIRHACRGMLDGRGLGAFEASYMIYAGQTMMQVSNTVYAVDAPDWPMTRITPRTVLGRLAARAGRPTGLVLENPEFNARFRVATDHEDFAVTLLSPEMQEFLLDKTTVRWRIGRGRVWLIYGGAMKPARLEASLDRLRGFWMRVPAELEGW